MISKQQRQALKQMLKLLHIQRKQLVVAVLLGAAALGASIALGATSAWLIAYASFLPPVLYLEMATVSVRLFGISKALFRYLDRLAGHRIAVGGMALLRGNVYRRLADAPTATVASLKRGDLLERVQTDVDNVGDFVVKSLLPALVTAFVGLCTVLFFLWIDPLAALFLLVGLLLAGVVAPALTVRSALATAQAEEEARVGVSVAAFTIAENAADLSVNGRKGQLLNALDAWETSLADAKDRSARPAALATALDTASMLATVLACTWAGALAITHQDMNPILLAVLTLTPLASFEGTALLGPAAIQLVISARSAERLLPLLEVSEETQPCENEALNRLAGPGVVLEATDVSVGWQKGQVVAEGINLRLQPGKHYAVVGPSGIGKTTLLYTLTGLLRPLKGRVTLGGVDVCDLPREQVARFFSVTMEDAHIFETSVLENLRVARGNLTEQEARELLGKAGLSQWLDSLPEGLQTVLGSRGSTISGGERRRLLLARSLASPAPLLALDEPGEHLDPATADELLTQLLSSAELDGRGSLIITHRLAPLAAADEIYVFGAGAERAAEAGDVSEASDVCVGWQNKRVPARIVAQGTHAELLRSCEQYAWAFEQEQVDRW